MSEISRRILLTGAGSAPLLAQQAARTAAATAPARDTVPKRRLMEKFGLNPDEYQHLLE